MNTVVFYRLSIINVMIMLTGFLVCVQSSNMNKSGAFAAPVTDKKSSVVDFQILAVNDFHGQMAGKLKLDGRPVGGAAVLVSYLKNASSGMENSTVFAEVGDLIGASEPSSALLQDEPPVMMFNSLGNKFCRSGDKFSPYNNIVGTLGNHEFDEGLAELNRILNGGNYRTGHFLENLWSGAHFPVVCANAIDMETGLPLVLPFVVKQIPRTQIRIAFIGIIFKDAGLSISASVSKKMKFTDEVEAVNRNVKTLRDSLEIHAFVILIHQGQDQRQYEGPTDSSKTPGPGAITNLIAGLDDDVDVVCSAHSHSFFNALVPNENGKKILVTQAYLKGKAYADIDLKIDADTKDVIYKTAAIVTAWADGGPGLTPDQPTTVLMNKIDRMVAPITKKVIYRTDSVIERRQNMAGESPLGDLIADAQCSVMATDFAFMNPGGIRADIDTGEITWEDLFNVQPFNNRIVKITMTGKQIYDVLNQQWMTSDTPKMLQVSGLTYKWDAVRPANDRVLEVCKNGKPITKSGIYSVSINNFLAEGGDGFTVFTQGKDAVDGAVDIDILVQYLSNLQAPLKVMIDGRIQRGN